VKNPVDTIVGVLVAVFGVGIIAFIVYKYIKKKPTKFVTMDSSNINPLSHRTATVTTESETKTTINRIV
jgi:ABC-type uncharacterized transport system permease subunit